MQANNILPVSIFLDVIHLINSSEPGHICRGVVKNSYIIEEFRVVRYFSKWPISLAEMSPRLISHGNSGDWGDKKMALRLQTR